MGEGKTDKIIHWLIRIILAIWILVFHKIFWGWITQLINPGEIKISKRDLEDFISVSILFAIVVIIMLIIKAIIKKEKKQ